MNPENVKISQIVGSFTAKDWGVAITVISTAISGTFWTGNKYAEAQSLAQLAELKGTVAQLQAKLEVNQSRAESLATYNGQCRDAYQKTQELITQRNQQVAQLSTQLGRESNCSFIHEQIRATRAEIEHPGGIVVFEAGKEWEEKQKFRKAVLEKRLEGYQQQLGSCNK